MSTVRRRCEELRARHAAAGSVEKLVTLLSSRLARVDQGALVQAARECGEDLSKWSPGISKHHAFARLLLGAFTSNEERDLPAAFVRRCVILRLPRPTEAQLNESLRSYLGDLRRSDLLVLQREAWLHFTKRLRSRGKSLTSAG
jgi:hypothetical protein